MAQRKLTDDQKLHIGECYSSDQFWTQDKLASTYNVSRKTIYRVLSELGLLSPKVELSPGSARIVEVVRSLGLDEHSVYQALHQPILSRPNMVAVLAKMDLTDIELLFADVVQHKHLANHGTTPNEPQLAPDSAAGAAVESAEDAAVPVLPLDQ